MSVLTDQLKADFKTIFDLGKEDVILQSVTKTRDANDNLVISTTDTTQKARIEILEEDFHDEFGGVLHVGDAIAYFKPGVTIKLDDRIVHEGVTYEVQRIIRERVKDVIIFQTVFLRRIS